ncbi:MAG: tyrosine-type recombinase/integrase [Acidocella sp.]|nr:tyrosine-type recombinase/integrase [Acidocella sp.]
MASTTDQRWLLLRHRTWWAVLDVPRKLRKVIGKPRFAASLKTHDLATAQARRWSYLAQWRAQIDAHTSGAAEALNITEEGLAWRDTLERIDRGDPATVNTFRSASGPYPEDPDRPYTPQEDAREVARMTIQDRLEDLHHLHGRTTDADTLAGLAFGTATPLTTFVKEWLAEGGRRGPYPPRTISMYRADVQRLADWLTAEGIPQLVESVTRKVAGRWVLALSKSDRERETTNRRITAVSAYWDWLRRRHDIDLDPWSRQRLSLARSSTDDGEDDNHRAYTDSEMLRLLLGPANTEMHDAIRLAALSGMRQGELYRLRVSDCQGGRFLVRKGKSSAARRFVPIHSNLEAIVSQRLAGKATDAFLMHEESRTDNNRAAPFSKRFRTYRLSLGVTDKANEDDRQDRVNFHSFRHWFVTQARRHADQAVVARIVGHAQQTITDGRYNHGPGIDTERACVEAVKLPTP